MRKSLLWLIVAIIASSPALAQTFSERVGKPYISVDIGVNEVDDTSFNFTTGVDVKNEYDRGYVVTAEAGYNFGQFLFIDNVKLGAELGYSENDIDVHKISALGGKQSDSTGELSATTLLANMYHEYDTNTRFVPYYGLGVGFAKVDAQGFGVPAAPKALDDDDVAFMYQLNVGVNYLLTSNIDIGARYRYSATEGLELTGAGADAQDKDFDFESHNFTINVSYRF